MGRPKPRPKFYMLYKPLLHVKCRFAPKLKTLPDDELRQGCRHEIKRTPQKCGPDLGGTGIALVSS